MITAAEYGTAVIDVDVLKVAMALILEVERAIHNTIGPITVDSQTIIDFNDSRRALMDTIATI